MDKKEENLHLLRRYIKEAIDLGKVQFSPSRVDGVNSTEPNTPEENALYNSLQRRIIGMEDIDEKTAHILSQLINSEKYGKRGSGFFQGPQLGTQLYRGHAVDQTWVDKHVPAQYNIPRVDGSRPRALMDSEEITLKTPHVFTQRRGWTYKLITAAVWASDYATGHQKLGGYNSTPDLTKNFAVVYIIDTDKIPPNAMLDFEHSVYKTATGREFSSEQEVMNLLPINVTKVKIVSTSSEY
jgi:hypothetical protein